MVNEANYNLVKLTYNMTLLDAFTIWMQKSDKSFLACFKESIVNNQVSLKLNNKEVPARDILADAIKSVKSTVVIQTVCYIYEMLYKNYDYGLSKDKATFDRIKNNVLQGNKSFNNEQLLSHIRNAIAHNDDLDTPCYDYDFIREVFTFLPTKKKQTNNSTRVIISEEELVTLMVQYIKNISEYKQLNYILDIDIDKIRSKKLIYNVEEFIKLRNIRTNEILHPDENQRKIIKQLILDIRDNKIKETDNLNFFYPYKQNTLNNFIRTIDFYHLLNCLKKLRGENLQNFISTASMHTPSGLTELKDFGDILSMFLSNNLFQIFSTTPNNVLHDQISSELSYIPLNKLRNAIMHGTYYKDINASLYIYDGPRDDKTEEKLEFIDSFDCETLDMLIKRLFIAKCQSLTENNKENQVLKIKF